MNGNPNTIGLVGGSGYVGDNLVDALLARGYQVSLLVRAGREGQPHRANECRLVVGEPDDPEALARLFDGCRIAFFAIGILREDPRRNVTFERLQYEAAAATLRAAKKAGVERFLLMSANGVREDGTAYQATKYRAERAAFASGIQTTVFRPSVIFGDPRGKQEFATQLLNDMVRPPIPAVNFFSVAGPHRGPVKMSPVHIRDVVDAIVAAAEQGESAPDIVPLGGPTTLTWKAMIELVARAVDRTKWFLPMPIELMSLAATLLDWLPAFPVSRDQLTMLAEGNLADPATMEALIGRPATPFTSDNLDYLNGP